MDKERSFYFRFAFQLYAAPYIVHIGIQKASAELTQMLQQNTTSNGMGEKRERL